MKMITVRVSDEDLAAIDRVRGDAPRERWIRRLCADAVLAHDVTISGTRPAPSEPRKLAAAPDVERGRVVNEVPKVSVAERMRQAAEEYPDIAKRAERGGRG